MKDWGRGAGGDKRYVKLHIPATLSRILHYINPCRLLSVSVWTPPVIMISHLTWQHITLFAVLSDHPQKVQTNMKTHGFWCITCLGQLVWKSGCRLSLAPGWAMQLFSCRVCRHVLPALLPMTNTLSCFQKVLTWWHTCCIPRGRGRCQQLSSLGKTDAKKPLAIVGTTQLPSPNLWEMCCGVSGTFYNAFMEVVSFL